jgi:hypothetical protein
MLDISDLEPKAVASFLVSSLVGLIQKKSPEINKFSTISARLIDKAKNEYILAREKIIEEEKEGKLTHEEIENRDKGQYFFTCLIIDHLENCLNAISRIYKLFRLLPSGYNSPQVKSIKAVRNTIEHMDARISDAVGGSLSLNISEDALSIEIANDILSLDDLATEIRSLHKEILQIIQI